MQEPYLEVTFRHGRALAAYYYLPHSSDAQVVRSSKKQLGLIVDYAEADLPLGIEITTPHQVTLEAFNALLKELDLAALGEADLAPLQAA